MSFIDLVSHVAGNFVYEAERDIKRRSVVRIIDELGYIRELKKTLNQMEKDRVVILKENWSAREGKVFCYEPVNGETRTVSLKAMEEKLTPLQFKKHVARFVTTTPYIKMFFSRIEKDDS
jgi:hypothetical protein